MYASWLLLVRFTPFVIAHRLGRAWDIREIPQEAEGNVGHTGGLAVTQFGGQSGGNGSTLRCRGGIDTEAYGVTVVADNAAGPPQIL